MAAGSGSQTKSSRSAASAKTAASKRKTSRSSSGNKKRKPSAEPMDSAVIYDILMILLFAIAIILFLCNFGVIGPAGNAVSKVMFGIFGILAYVVPIAAFVGIAFATINQGNTLAKRKLAAALVLLLLAGISAELFSGALTKENGFSLAAIYNRCASGRSGGGAIAGSAAYLLYHFLDTVGSVLVILVIGVICIVVVTEKSFIDGLRSSGHKVMEISAGDAQRRRERARERREEMERLREEQARKKEEAARQKRLKEEEKENERILRMDKRVSGVMLNTSLAKEEAKDTQQRDDIHEIKIHGLEDLPVISREVVYDDTQEMAELHEAAFEAENSFMPEEEPQVRQEIPVAEMPEPRTEAAYTQEPAEAFENPSRGKPEAKPGQAGGSPVSGADSQMLREMEEAGNRIPKKYQFPPLSRLQKGSSKVNKDSARLLKETAVRLQQTLATFGVRVTVTDISQGPSVTRYELQPEQGVKVSKIVGLADDIKLNLAATDIRIEAPIPGKAAVGIEVPNKENTPVALRDLLETGEFKEFPSNLAFAVGKDIAGKPMIADIAKMPHMLIAGATGSGKSVCINTLIMSILYKAHPDDVKLIMVDPKVVELSVYNGIPHLMIPVVTDPKKAAAALQWGVAEMSDRYQKFADYNVRDLKGYNKKVESMLEKDPAASPKLPQIVIIVDELADLMMVAAGEVEEAICRLAQLARAAGIHLIIATQRPSVDVITGLIKANMPSRVAFSVSSGVDSRTILDMNGAEKLLGKGDMLFYPQGFAKPARVQGAFVSDKEVSDVVDFLKNQILGNTYYEDIEEKIQSIGSTGAGVSGAAGAAERDEYFEKAGIFIIEKDKASIGMLQRYFKVGFNRAARIMDQLSEAGVVGEEEGTKPRKVLMSMEQFEQYLEEY